jgi:hypothetical protein
MHKIRNFHEGHGTVGEWQGIGMVCVNRPLLCHTAMCSYTAFCSILEGAISATSGHNAVH